MHVHPDRTTESPHVRARRATLLVTVLTSLAGALGGCGGHETEVDARAVAVVVAGEPPAPRPTVPLAPGAGCLTSRCHSTMATGSNVHGVLRGVDRCGVCHEDDQGGHVFPLKRAGNAGCLHCHENIIGQKLHRHGGADVDCLSCHDPHVSEHSTLLRADSTSALCAGCHAPDAPSVPHGPFAAGECSVCHAPHESDFPGLLRGGEGPAHCALCHESMERTLAEATFVHAPAATDCRGCHQPHGSDFRFGLRDEVDQTCFACHEDIEAMTTTASAPHGAMLLDDRCANCHDPHASNQPHLLRDRQDVLCLSCHDQPVEAWDGRVIPDMTATLRDREFLHGPVRTGDCTACHSVHGGSHERLLRGDFTSEFYASFDVSQYALCFTCHESDLVTTERTDALTDFRDGDVNLHFLHVNRQQKGRTCRACHEMHGSDLPAHVAESVPFDGSGWALPIGFRQTPTGGSCSPGCHKPMGYDRVVPVMPLTDASGPAGPGGAP